MSGLTPIHTEYYDDAKRACEYYAGLRCLGVPGNYLELSRERNGQTALTVLSSDPDKMPPGFPKADECMESRLESYHLAVAKLGGAMQQLTGWPCQFHIRYSEQKQDYVFSADVAPPAFDRNAGSKMTALHKLMKQIHRETGIEAPMSKRAFDAEHPLHDHATSDLSFEFPLDGAFLKLSQCSSLDTYSENTSTPARAATP